MSKYRNFIPIKEKIKKRIYLKQVRKRLENEAGIYFGLLSKAQSENREFPKVGFWAGIRILMPVIEALSNVLLRETKKDPRPKEVRFLEKNLNFEYPALIWQMYRNPLMHTDQPASLIDGGHKISWGISMRADHFFTPDEVNLDPTRLYKDLKDFLDKEVERLESYNGYVFVEKSIKTKRTTSKYIKSEIKKIKG